jgi:integrase
MVANSSTKLAVVGTQFFSEIVEAALFGLDSAASQKQYRYTYNMWELWCNQNGLNALTDLSMVNVRSYLVDIGVTYTTRQNHLSHLRKLTKFLSIYHDEFKKRHEELMYMKVPPRQANEQTHEVQALEPDIVQEIINCWSDDTSLKAIRNNAFVRVSFGTGGRITEMANMQWEHIDFKQRTVLIPHGKGDKRRIATIIDDSGAIPALLMFQAMLPHRIFVFPGIKKNDEAGADRPMTRQSCHRIIVETGERLGIELHHHLARKTLGTELMTHGGEGIIADVMAQFGHAKMETLINHYVKPAQAAQRQKRFKTGWGDDE